MNIKALEKLVLKALEDLKATEIRVLGVSELTSVTDMMIFATGTSTRHVKSIAAQVVKEAKDHDCPPIGVEGEESGEWVLVDLGDIVVHVMLAQIRDFYNLEKLWSMDQEAVSNQPT